MSTAIESLKEYIKCKSISTNPDALAGMEEARTFVSNLLTEMGFTVEIVDTPKHPIVFAKRPGPANAPHLVLYGHYDIQPEDPVELWSTPPFEPTVKDGRLYARGAADNKGPQLAMLFGLKAALEENPDLPLQLTVMIEGEEEIGSPSFPEFLKNRKDELDADLVVLSDTSSPSKDQIVITTGVRGVAAVEVKAKGPARDLHSGFYGGAIANPITALTSICGSLHDEDGRVNIPGFYDDVIYPEAWEREEFKAMKCDPAEWKSLTGATHLTPQGDYSPFEATVFLPTLDFNGIGGGFQGEGGKTIIPSEAFVKITSRLVPGQDPQKIEQQIIETIKDRCPEGIHLSFETEGAGGAYHVNVGGIAKDSVQGKIFNLASEAIQETFGKKPLFIRSGGSINLIGQIKSALGLDSLMIGLFLPEDNLHSPDESMDLELFENGIQAYKAFFSKFA